MSDSKVPVGLLWPFSSAPAGGSCPRRPYCLRCCGSGGEKVGARGGRHAATVRHCHSPLHRSAPSQRKCPPLPHCPFPDKPILGSREPPRPGQGGRRDVTLFLPTGSTAARATSSLGGRGQIIRSFGKLSQRGRTDTFSLLWGPTRCELHARPALCWASRTGGLPGIQEVIPTPECPKAPPRAASTCCPLGFPGEASFFFFFFF